MSSGLDVFPFQADWGRRLSADKRMLSSLSVGGSVKSRSKGSRKIGVDPQFDDRFPEEWNAAVAFWDENTPGSFVYRDSSVYPEVDTEMRFVSGPAQSGNNFRDISYGFSALEA